jgi:hypothetical protein
MSTSILTLLTFIIEEAVKIAPGFIQDLLALFSEGTPTATDFATLRAKIQAESYGQFVPGSILSGATPPPVDVAGSETS